MGAGRGGMPAPPPVFFEFVLRGQPHAPGMMQSAASAFLGSREPGVPAVGEAPGGPGMEAQAGQARRPRAGRRVSPGPGAGGRPPRCGLGLRGARHLPFWVPFPPSRGAVGTSVSGNHWALGTGPDPGWQPRDCGSAPGPASPLRGSWAHRAPCTPAARPWPLEAGSSGEKKQAWGPSPGTLRG